MDVSNEASIGTFPIGPSTIIGRTAAFRILFCKSISQLRHQILHALQHNNNFIYRCKQFLPPLISAFINPRNPQGMLALVTVIALLLKQYANVKLRAEMAYRRKFWRNMMRSALTYEEWAHASKMLDKETNQKMSESDLYDEELIKNKLSELRKRRQDGSLRDIMFWMRADLIRNLGNMCNPELHKGRLHVPKLIKEYIDEVSTQLRMVCDSADSEENITLEEKLAFMHETRHSFGRTALLLSGGGSLGVFHIGVIKTLVELRLLPRIIAGSSAGSIMCSLVATRSWPELQSFFEDSWRSLQLFDELGGIFVVVRRIMRQGVLHDIRHLQWMLRRLTSNLTFQEAYDMTGRILVITVCSPRKHESPRCLNYLNSPHVVIWSAVTASCAFPGLFEAQELMAKDRSGQLVPYHPPFNLDPDEGCCGKSSGSSRRWRDGSLEVDLPMIQLKELFNVNHFIVSQANPHIAPLLRFKEFVRAFGGNFAAKLAHLTEMEVKHRCSQMLELGFPLMGLAKLFAQDWEGDITIVMPATLDQYTRLIQNPPHLELQKLANQGRRCTWEKLSAIQANCGIELVLDECVAILNHMRRLKRSADKAAAASGQPSPAAKFNASRRIPSWNCIARENSTGSLDEAVPPTKKFQARRDGSDSDSDGVDQQYSWTRSGGPLMRTTSANLFIDFVRNIDENSDQVNQCLMGSSRGSGYEFDQRDSVNGSSIVLAEGDLLQPERIRNGFLINVVKKEDLALSHRSHYGSENCGPECLQLEYGDQDTTEIVNATNHFCTHNDDNDDDDN